MLNAELEYLAAGSNRHPSAADWKPGLLAFGSGHNIALWDPEEEGLKGVTALLAGHTDVVNAVKIYDGPQGRHIITGAADQTIRIWKAISPNNSFKQTQCLTEHQSSVNVISALPGCGLLVSGSADGTVKIWGFSKATAELVQSISLKPRYLPLTCALAQLDGGNIVLAVGGTSTSIQLYIRTSTSAEFELQATLAGHEGWIRSLDFTEEVNNGHRDVLLASASQDKYIRLWRLHESKEALQVGVSGSIDVAAAAVKKSLSNKAHQVGSQEHKYNVTFEALLIGHEDWIYTARWAPIVSQASPKLLSASADNSLAIWSADELSGIWVCQSRLGEISAQKGSTTATGSTGGFWIGLWQPEGSGVVSLGRTGSWRRWTFDLSNDSWVQQVAISGHTREVRGCAWSPDGSYLLTTGSDQTTRLFAEWKRNGIRSWHEFARPQIHGYDLNCIDSITSNQFISGADEKLLRVFNKPGVVHHLLSKLCGVESSVNGGLPDAANIPVLGLSNKAIAPVVADEMPNGTLVDGHDEHEEASQVPVLRKSTLDLDHPPFEEHLARHTLWPEHEKLYGHGYEISAVAASHDGSLVATACKASSLDHAVIRLYDCHEWREIRPPLTAHSLTVTSLTFSSDDRYLLSVGRDRSLVVFQRGEGNVNSYDLLWSNPKAHSRMILDCSWSPSGNDTVFASAGRDKAVKIWKLANGKAECVQSISATAAVTAVAFDLVPSVDNLRLVYGTEDGNINIVSFAARTLAIVSNFALERYLVPSQAVNALRWRPRPSDGGVTNEPEIRRLSQLAVVSDDSSLRMFHISP